MKGVIIGVVVVLGLGFFCETRCCEEEERCERNAPVYNERFVELIREKTPGFESNCDIEVSSGIARDAAIFMWPHKRNKGAGFLDASCASFVSTVINLGEGTGNWSLDPSQIDSKAADILRRARLNCLSSAEQYIGNYKTYDDILQSFIRIGCLVYCGDVEALKILAKMFEIAGNFGLANRACIATTRKV
jgi:hypothetical protein